MPAPNLSSDTYENGDGGDAGAGAVSTFRLPHSSTGTVGENAAPPVRFLGSRIQNPLGDGMTGWSSSVDPSNPQYLARPAPSPQQPGGLPGLMLDYLRDNPNN
jgi:hypothetical protein